LFLLDARFGDAAIPIFANKKLGQQIKWRGRGGKTNSAKRSPLRGERSSATPGSGSPPLQFAQPLGLAANVFQAFERNAQVGAAFVAGEGMQFVDDDEFGVGKMLRVTLLRQENRQLFGCGDEKM